MSIKETAKEIVVDLFNLAKDLFTVGFNTIKNLPMSLMSNNRDTADKWSEVVYGPCDFQEASYELWKLRTQTNENWQLPTLNQLKTIWNYETDEPEETFEDIKGKLLWSTMIEKPIYWKHSMVGDEEQPLTCYHAHSFKDGEESKIPIFNTAYAIFYLPKK